MRGPLSVLLFASLGALCATADFRASAWASAAPTEPVREVARGRVSTVGDQVTSVKDATARTEGRDTPCLVIVSYGDRAGGGEVEAAADAILYVPEGGDWYFPVGDVYHHGRFGYWCEAPAPPDSEGCSWLGKVVKKSGDPDIYVAEGEEQVLTPANMGEVHWVQLGASEDADSLDGDAVFEIVFSGETPDCPPFPCTDETIAVREADDDRLEVDATSVAVAEEGTAEFKVRPRGRQSVTVVVSTSRVDGDEDISAAAGGTVTFGASDWSGTPGSYAWESVILQAADDEDIVNGEATFEVAGQGEITFPTETVTATEVDDDEVQLVDQNVVAGYDDGNYHPEYN